MNLKLKIERNKRLFIEWAKMLEIHITNKYIFKLYKELIQIWPGVVPHPCPALWEAKADGLLEARV